MIYKKAVPFAAAALVAAVPVYELSQDGDAKSLKDRTPVAVAQVAVSTSTATTPSGPYVPNTVLGGHNNASYVREPYWYVEGPETPGKDKV
jgi:hypothetical protein